MEFSLVKVLVIKFHLSADMTLDVAAPSEACVCQDAVSIRDR